MAARSWSRRSRNLDLVGDVGDGFRIYPFVGTREAAFPGKAPRGDGEAEAIGTPLAGDQDEFVGSERPCLRDALDRPPASPVSCVHVHLLDPRKIALRSAAKLSSRAPSSVSAAMSGLESPLKGVTRSVTWPRRRAIVKVARKKPSTSTFPMNPPLPARGGGW